MSRIQEIIRDAKSVLPENDYENDYIELKNTPEELYGFPDPNSHHCGIRPIEHMFSWKTGFQYLLTGSPNAGKTTYYLYKMFIMSFWHNWKWCIWSSEMYDAYADKKSGIIIRHAKDLINLLIWTLYGVTPFESYSKKHDVPMLSKSKIIEGYQWVQDHFKFVHMKNRAPGSIISAFGDMQTKYGINGFLLDPWKSVKQAMNGMRSDIWLEDVLYMFGDFALETDTIMNYVVHPKSLRDYKNEEGEYRIITPWDLNGGAAWHNTMDVIGSLRKLLNENRTEFYTSKVRKQHIVGSTDAFTNVTFDMNKYRFYFDGYCPIERRNVFELSTQFPTNNF